MPINPDKWSKNYLFEHKLILIQRNAKAIDPNTGYPSIIKFFDFGGTRSSKTWDNFQLILYYLLEFSNNSKKKLHVDIYRKTMVLCRDNSFKDCLDCFDNLGLIKKSTENPKNYDFEAVGDSGSVAPTIRIWGHTIDFKGMPIPTLSGKIETGQADIVYINEITENDNKNVMVKIMQRCYMLFIADGNPSASVHWAYDMKDVFNTFYTRTTYLDNVHLPPLKRGEYESWCPWEFEDSIIEEEDVLGIGKGFKRRVWLKPERPEHISEEMDVNHEYRRDNKRNIQNRTADRAQYLIYCEGLSAGQSGSVFKYYTPVESFPEIMEEVHFGLDFGYSNDPSCLTRVGIKSGMDLYIENHTYQPTPTPEILWDLIVPQIEIEIERRKKEAKGNEIADIIVMCESNDMFKDGSGFYRFVEDMNMLSMKYGKNWQFTKVEKPNIVPRVSAMKKFNLFLVIPKDDGEKSYRYLMGQKLQQEQQNYIYLKNADDSPSNIPDPKSKWNHAWDSSGYCVWGLFAWRMEGGMC